MIKNTDIASSHDPLETAQDLLDQGLVLALMGNKGQATFLFRQALIVDGDNAVGRYLLGMMLRVTGREAEAQAEWRLMKQTPTENMPSHAPESFEWGGSKMVYAASDRASSVVVRELLDQGLLLALMGKKAPATVLFRHALDIDADNPFGHYMLGMMYHVAGREPEARAEWQLMLPTSTNEAHPEWVRVNFRNRMVNEQRN